MTNLFSVFDPSSSMGLSLNWGILGLSLALLPLSKWLQSARWPKLVSLINSKLFLEIHVLLSLKSKFGSVVFLTLFYWIVLNISVGLLPYIFTSTSHLAVSLSLALPLWLGYYLQGWVTSTKKMLAHLVPLGTPWVLMPFMVLVESVSSLIRPGTLAVRLAANMIAGHLLLTLLSSTAESSEGLASLSVLSGQILLVLLEMAVAFIQAYVFMTLSALYSSES